MTRFK
jgi:hypothetical protein